MSSEAPGLVYPKPRLAGDGVVLSPWDPADGVVLAAAWADPVVQAGCAVPPEPKRSIADAQRWIEGHEQRMAARLSVDLVVRDASTGAAMGEVGLGPFDWSKPAAALGFWTAVEHRGHGWATKASALLCDWAFREFGLVAILAETTTTNVGSQRVLATCGFALHKTAEPKQVWVKHHPNPEILAVKVRGEGAP